MKSNECSDEHRQSSKTGEKTKKKRENEKDDLGDVTKHDSTGWYQMIINFKIITQRNVVTSRQGSQTVSNFPLGWESNLEDLVN